MVPLEILGEEGIMGFVLFSLFTIFVIQDGMRAVRAKHLPTETRVNIGMLLALFTFEFILCCKQGSILITPGAGVFCMGSCLAWAVVSLPKRSRRSQKSSGPCEYYPNQASASRY